MVLFCRIDPVMARKVLTQIYQPQNDCRCK